MLNQRIFRVSAGLGIGSIAVMAFLFLGAQQAFPFFIGNVGSFMIKADAIEADGFELLLGVDENSAENGGQLPTGEVNLGEANITGLVIEKAFNVTSVIGNVAQPEWKLVLDSGAPVNLSGVRINAIGLCADEFTASGLVADAKGANTATFVDDFSLTSDSIVLDAPGIEASYLATSSITLQSLTLVVEPGGYDKAACLP